MARLEDRFPIYRQLLRLYPPDYQANYGHEMLQTLADMLDNAPSGYDRARVRLQVAIDFPVSLARQEIFYLGGIMSEQMPSYMKRNALIGAALLIPFVLALLANGLDKAIYNRTLEQSWLWHAPFASLWVLWLPLAATILALATLVVYILQQPGGDLKRLFRVQYFWPILGVALIGLFILAVLFGHDSTHCVLGNPITELGHPQHTWQCISQGVSNYPFEHPLTFLRRAFLGHN